MMMVVVVGLIVVVVVVVVVRIIVVVVVIEVAVRGMLRKYLRKDRVISMLTTIDLFTKAYKFCFQSASQEDGV